MSRNSGFDNILNKLGNPSDDPFAKVLDKMTTVQSPEFNPLDSRTSADLPQDVKSVLTQEFLQKRDEKRQKEAPVWEKFKAGAQAALLHQARGFDTTIAKIFGDDAANAIAVKNIWYRGVPGESLSKALDNYDTAISWKSQEARGLAGMGGQIVGTAIPVLATYAGPQGAVVGSGFTFAQSWGNAQADIDQFERYNGVKVPSSVRHTVGVGSGVLDVIANLIPLGVAGKFVKGGVVSSLGTKVLAKDFKGATALLTKTLGIDAGLSSTVFSGVQLAHNAFAKWYGDDERDLTEGVGSAAALGGLLSVAHGVSKLGGLVRVSDEGLKLKTAKVLESMLADKMLTQAEATALLADQKNLAQNLVDIHQNRVQDRLVELTFDNGEVGVKSRPDVLTYEQKKALGNNQELISLYREAIERGEKVDDLFIKQELGPPSAEEIETVKSRLLDLKSKIMEKVDPSEFSPEGIPLTRRALVVSDVDVLLKNLESKPTRADVEIGMVLDQVPEQNSNKALPPTIGILGPRETVLTKVNLEPVRKTRLKYTDAESSGFLNDATELTDDLRKQSAIRKAQQKFIKRTMTLGEGTRLEPEQALVVGKAVEAEFLATIERILSFESDVSKSVKKTLRREVGKKVKQKNQIPLLDAIDTVLKDITESAVVMSQRETVARVIEGLADPKYGIPEEALKALEELHQRMLVDEALQPWAVRVKQGLRDAQALQSVEIQKLKDQQGVKKQIVEILKKLPDEYARDLLEANTKADTPEQITALLGRIVKVQDKYLRNTSNAAIKKMLDGIERNPQRDAVFELIRSLSVDDGSTGATIQKSTKTGRQYIDPLVLKNKLRKLSTEELENLTQDIKRLVRRGQMEQGLYAKYLKLQTDIDVPESLEQIRKYQDLSQAEVTAELPLHLAKVTFDPVSVEGWLWQLSDANPDLPLYKILVSDIEDSWRTVQHHYARTRKFLNDRVKTHLGIDTSSIFGELKFLGYLNKKLNGKVTRAEAMWAYALLTDSGRREVLIRDGVSIRGQTYTDIAEIVGLLTKQDMDFVVATKEYFRNNAFVERAFANMEFFTGTSPQRADGWFTSRRVLKEMKPSQTFADFELELVKEVDALKARSEDAGAPFRLDGGYLSAFYRVADRLALYGESGRKLYRAERLVGSTEFRDAFVRKFGKSRYDSVVMYLSNNRGLLGSVDSTINKAVSQLVVARNTSRLALNVFSALKQAFGLITAQGDNLLTQTAIPKALAEGAGFSTAVDKRMFDWSGFTYMRLSAGRYAEQLILTGVETATPRFAALQEMGLILQRKMDQATLRVLWRAAEIDAEALGLKGRQARDYVQQTFEKLVTRNQTSNSPIYATELELTAKRHPALLGVLSFKRELNRNYNTVRRHVVTAIKNPSKENLQAAGRSIFWNLVVNTTAEMTVNTLKLAAYGSTAYASKNTTDWGVEALTSLAGRWYLAGDVVEIFNSFRTTGPNTAAERQLGPIVSTTMEAFKAAYYTAAAVEAGKEPETNYVTTGINRGRSKSEVAIEKAVDNAMSALGGVSALPFWALWVQGKGLYNWTRDDYRLMVNLEREQESLRRDPEVNAWRLKEIQDLRDKVMKVHRDREAGRISEEDAKVLIRAILE